MQRRAMVCGVCGQDGSYLARFLLAKGYAVVGTSRNRRTASLANLTRLGIHDRIELRTLDPGNVEGVDRILAEEQPDEVYNLTGPSSVRLSFERPVETVKSISRGSLGLLEAIRRTRPSVRYYNAGSSERFGSIADGAATEATALRPCSPYGVGKVAAYWQVSMYRLTHGLSACTGFLFNHESPLRPESYVTRRVVAAACRIASGSRERLRLGELGVQRDWGWAPDYVEAMWLMLQQERPEDFVIATGSSHSLEQLVEVAFAEVGLRWREHVDIDPALFRPRELMVSRADPARARRRLGWSATHGMHDVVRLMVEAEKTRSVAGASGKVCGGQGDRDER